jgi:hypothetical protein
MKPETQATIERIVQATGTSALRAAAQIILDHLPKGEMEEGEEKKIYDGILLSSNDTNKAFTAAMVISGVLESYQAHKQAAMNQFAEIATQKAGNC